MRKIFIYLLIMIPLIVSSCLDDDSAEENDDYVGNFEAAWTALDEKYCFFNEKNVDWDAVHDFYYPYFKDSIKTITQQFSYMASMLAVLKDGHVNLYSPFNTARYWKWFEDYPDNFDENLLYNYYLGTNYWIASGMEYGYFSDSIGYVRYSSFSTTPGETNVDYVLAALKNCKGLIIDIRNNGGGSLTNVPILADRFATEKTCYGYMLHKTGKGHDEFSDPEAMYLEPPSGTRILWDASIQPVAVLTNRQTFSAANNFVQAMRALNGTKTEGDDGVTRDKIIRTIGDKTGGGGGMPLETVLPNGWILRFSACPILDQNKKVVEDGIDPDIKCDMDSTSMIVDHKDDIIERAREFIINNTRKTYKAKIE